MPSRKKSLVLIPGQSISHLNPIMEFAALCLRRGLAVTVVVPNPTLTTPTFLSPSAGTPPGSHLIHKFQTKVN
jgi:hypothetical protein